MKKLVIICITLFSLNCIGQTKKETEDWISNKVHEYRNSKGVDEDFWFENGYLYHYWSINTAIQENTKSLNWSVKIQDIVAIETICRTAGCEFIIHTKKGKLFLKKSPEDADYKVYNRPSFNVNMNKDFNADGTKDRIEKASIHLIKLYGGDAIIKKEPF
jgi:hypothetical protein